MRNSYATKLLRATFTLSTPGAVFPGDPNKAANVLTLVGLRMQVGIRCSGAPAFPSAEIAIFGMAQSDMNALSSLTFEVTGINRNSVVIEANATGDDPTGWSSVYAGQITTAFVDYSGAPEVCLRISAQMGFFDQINPATPTSYTSSVAVATVVASIASKMQFAFENHGVFLQTGRPTYYPGVLTEQLRDVVNDYGIDLYMEAGALVQTIAIVPKGFSRDTPGYTLTPATGLVGYPVVDARGFIKVRALYNPAFRFGGPLTIDGSDVILDGTGTTVKTINSQANGLWLVGQMSHMLESVKPGGAWFSDMLLYPPGQEPPQS